MIIKFSYNYVFTPEKCTKNVGQSKQLRNSSHYDFCTLLGYSKFFGVPLWLNLSEHLCFSSGFVPLAALLERQLRMQNELNAMPVYFIYRNLFQHIFLDKQLSGSLHLELSVYDMSDFSFKVIRNRNFCHLQRRPLFIQETEWFSLSEMRLAPT